ncbi:hypothetical protein SteCoe_16124 [Stentor coeruleus]|uniref:EF-hand domain-containing protein n=1 Tax=Stentor coeruleus TaxID=5963 RepID=A0A1R2C1X1_9CILI|nr:hypothetical protein SteCoe_16124 [Stentor coeruleus]
MEKYFPKIVKKYKTLGISSLTPGEVCLTCLYPNFSEYFYQETNEEWSQILESYLPVLSDHLEYPEKAYRYAAGKMFLQCLDLQNISEKIVPKFSLTDDTILKKIAQVVKDKNLSLIQILTSNDKDSDGFLDKTEFVRAIEKLDLSPYDIIASIRIAGFRSGVDYVPISSFCDLISRRNYERKLKEYNLLTKILNLFAKQPGGIELIFRSLDKNRDGKVTLQEFRQGCLNLNISLSLKECNYIFAILDRDNSKSISLNELKAKLNEVSGKGRGLIAPMRKKSSLEPPGEFVVKILRGNVPHDATLVIKIASVIYRTKMYPVYGEICRLKGQKTIKAVLEIRYGDNGDGKADISESFGREAIIPVKIGHYEIEVSVRYEKIVGEDFKETQAVTVIQRAWRKYRAKIFTKTPKKLITRKTISAYNKRFLMGIYSIDSGYYCQLHPADTNQIPLDTIISSNNFPIQPQEILIEKLQINPNLSITIEPNKLRIKGNLWVELVKLNNTQSVEISLNNNINIFSSLGDKAEFKDIKISRPCDLDYTANGNKGKLYWIHALYTPYKWTITSIIGLPGRSSFTIRFNWVPGVKVGEIEQAASLIQQQWKAKKQQRKIIDRKRFKKNNKSYILTVTDENIGLVLMLYILEDTGNQTLLDTVKTSSKDLKTIYSKLRITNNKIHL